MNRILINGTWVAAGTDRSRGVQNPATLEPLGRVPDCEASDVARAVAAARDAQCEWFRVAPRERAALLHEIGVRIGDRTDELARLLTQETGKPWCESIDCLDAAAAMFASCAAATAEAAYPRGAAAVGVVAVIVPFNFPLLLAASAIAPAIAAGRAVVLKPPHQNPLASLRLAESFAVLPPGVVNVITGGPDTGRALAEHPHVDRVAFTGSAAVAERIATAAHHSVDLECGSSHAFIVCADADLDLCVPSLAWARLHNAGQICSSSMHIYVERSIAGELVERMHQYVGFLEVDDPMKPPTDLGPLISLEAAHRVEDQVGRTLREGATLILGGRRFRPSGLPGHFFQPTILANVRRGGLPTREEILGPVVTICGVADLADALRLVSESAADSGASIYTGDPAAAAAAVPSLEAGRFRINDPASGTGPFGDMRHRGIRRALGAGSRVQGAAVLERKPWWFPYVNARRRTNPRVC